jgi:pSer/pThr/pTyr-binding forkhead associated (FHA) protein
VQIVVEKGVGKGSVYQLHDGVNTLGRDITNRIRLSDPKVSRHHCKIRKIGLSLFLSDLGTKNGTIVNGEAVAEREVGVGDSIAVGGTVLKVIEDSFQPADAFEQPATFSLFRIISMALSGARRDRNTPEPYRIPQRSRLAIWKPPSGTDPTESREDTVVATDHDLKAE